MSENEQNVRKWTKIDKMDTCLFWTNEQKMDKMSENEQNGQMSILDKMEDCPF